MWYNTCNIVYNEILLYHSWTKVKHRTSFELTIDLGYLAQTTGSHVNIIITHAPLFRGCVAYVYESPLGYSSLAMNIHNPFMHCVMSQYVFKLCDVIVLNNRISVATIMYAIASPCRIPLNGMFHQYSATQWSKLRIWKISNFVVPNSLGKRNLNSVWFKYVCDKSEKARVCARWQWKALDWCYWIALAASPVVQSSNAVSCVSLSFRTHPCVLAIKASLQLYIDGSHVFIMGIPILVFLYW